MAQYKILKGVEQPPMFKGINIRYFIICFVWFLVSLIGIVFTYFVLDGSLVPVIAIVILFIAVLIVILQLNKKWGKWGHIYFAINFWSPVKTIKCYQRPFIRKKPKK